MATRLAIDAACHAPLATVRMSDTRASALTGVGIVLTRPAQAAASLSAAIRARGGTAIEFPALDIAALPLDAQLKRTLEGARAYDYWIFVSLHAVEHGVRLLREAHIALAQAQAVAIGPSTQRALQVAGFANVLTSAAGFDSEALLALKELQQGERSALIFRGRGGRETLRAHLQARGWRVDYLECYERLAPHSDPQTLLASLAAGKVQAVSVMSVQTLENFLAMLGPGGAERLRATPLFVPHERIATAARTLGLDRIIVTGVGDDALLGALTRHFNRHD